MIYKHVKQEADKKPYVEKVDENFANLHSFILPADLNWDCLLVEVYSGKTHSLNGHSLLGASEST